MNIDMINKQVRRFHVKASIFGILSLIGFPLALSIDLYIFTCENLIEMKRVYFTSLLLIGGSVLGGALILLNALKELPKCPSCKKRFFLMQVQVVIATKNCPYCGETVVQNIA